jgi:ATP-binding cassette, subfamily B, bacterial PglK
VTQQLTPIKSFGALWAHISKRRRLQFALLMFLTVFAAFAEMISIGAVLPFLAILTAPERVFVHPAIQPLLGILEIGNPKQLMLPLTLLFASAALLSGTVRIMLLWVQVRLSFAVGADFAMEMYRRTLYQPYAVHLGRNSSEVINGISYKATAVVGGIILPALSVIGSVVVVSALLVGFLVVSPMVAGIVMGVFGIFYTLVLRLNKHKLHRNGVLLANQSTLALKSLQEGLGGIRDVLIYGCQEVYCRMFEKANRALRRAQGDNFLIAQSPRYVAETVGVVIMTVVVYVISTGPDGLEFAVPFLGALALAAQRMLPAFQQTYGGLAAIRASQASLIDVLEYLNQPLPAVPQFETSCKLQFASAIRLCGVSFRYDSKGKQVLSNVNLSIDRGSRVGFVGTTGSGKSTLLDMIMGLLHPTDGAIEIDGVKLDSSNAGAWQARIAHVPQAIYLSDATIAENIAFGCLRHEIDMGRVKLAAKRARVGEVIDALPDQYDALIGERGIRLSGGQRQRIGIARALYREADIIVLDEATSALDDDTERAVMESMDSLGRDITVLIIAHRLTTLRKCDAIVELEAGAVKSVGAYADLISARLEPDV